MKNKNHLYFKRTRLRKVLINVEPTAGLAWDLDFNSNFDGELYYEY